MKPRCGMDGHGCGREIVVTMSRQSVRAGIVSAVMTQSAGWQILHAVGGQFESRRIVVSLQRPSAQADSAS